MNVDKIGQFYTFKKQMHEYESNLNYRDHPWNI